MRAPDPRSRHRRLPARALRRPASARGDVHPSGDALGPADRLARERRRAVHEHARGRGDRVRLRVHPSRGRHRDRAAFGRLPVLLRGHGLLPAGEARRLQDLRVRGSHARPRRARFDRGGRRPLHADLPGEPRRLPEEVGKSSRRSIHARGPLAVHHELPDRLRDEHARDPARSRPPRRSGPLSLRLRAGHALSSGETNSSGDYLMNVIASRNGASLPSVGVVYGQGDVFRRNRARRKVGFTMLEVDGFPSEWVRQANRMDEVWVPSEFNRQGFVDSGVKRPIRRIPLGVDPNYFHPGIRGVPNPNGEFVFLSNFEWGERKEPWLLLRAFNDEFTARDPVRLVCKIINKDPEVHVRREIANLRLKESGGKISFVYNREFPYYQLGAFYRSADCFISAGRGEGWDMPLMEAMACGLPSIATDWGAHTEFVHQGIAYPLRIRKTIPAVAKCPYYEGFRWADPDPEHLRALLREVYENRDEARRRGAAAAREMAERWTWDHVAGKILARLEELEA
ncbi:MAG: hypothetical protein DMF54_05345 [Acidobacteria bacterium]|nr:MAG: hypothetical protein DMF54_05345 [Acidobacteriota bacterium]